jgi:hypothetical protein
MSTPVAAYASEVALAYNFAWWALLLVSPTVALSMGHWRRLAGHTKTARPGTSWWWIVILPLNLVFAVLASVGMTFAESALALSFTNWTTALVTALLEPFVFSAAVLALRPNSDVTWEYLPSMVGALGLSVTALVFLFLAQLTDGVIANYAPALLYMTLPFGRLLILALSLVESAGVVTTSYQKGETVDTQELLAVAAADLPSFRVALS